MLVFDVKSCTDDKYMHDASDLRNALNSRDTLLARWTVVATLWGPIEHKLQLNSVQGFSAGMKPSDTRTCTKYCHTDIWIYHLVGQRACTIGDVLRPSIFGFDELHARQLRSMMWRSYWNQLGHLILLQLRLRPFDDPAHASSQSMQSSPIHYLLISVQCIIMWCAIDLPESTHAYNIIPVQIRYNTV